MKNVLVGILKSQLDQRIERLISTYTPKKAFLNPIGGWREWGYDCTYEWQSYQDTRRNIGQFAKLSSAGNYSEVGFSTIPFFRNAPQSWFLVGLVQHPLTWIAEAKRYGYHRTPGDGLSWRPESELEYAKLWIFLTRILEENSNQLYRIEEALIDPEEFLENFLPEDDELDLEKYQPEAIMQVPTTTDEVWDLLRPHAERVGYTRSGYEEEFVWSKSSFGRLTLNDLSPVSVIIAARNNGPFLEDAIRSTLNQTIRPLEVIYVDDGSTDNSVEIAKQFPEVKVLTQPHSGVCAARNRGVLESKGTYILHLDGDDIFPQRYIEYKLHALKKDSSASFVYSSAQSFGNNFNQYWDTYDFELARLWPGNFINTSTLIRKDHFLKVGMWRETIGTAWDWDLFIRMGKAGYKGLRDEHGFLLYRHHSSSISYHQNLKDKQDEWEVYRMKYLIRNAHCRTQISNVLSGRMIEFFPTWMEAIVRNVTQYEAGLKRQEPYPYFGQVLYLKPNLTILYTGPAEHRKFINKYLDKHADVFNDINLLCQRWENVYEDETQRRDNVAEFMARSCNKLMRTDDEIVWFVEDDIIPPDHAMYELNKAVTAACIPLYGAAGIYRNRHDPAYLVAHNWEDLQNLGTVQNFTEFPEADVFVDITGTGCLMVFKPFANHAFKSHIQGIPAHDWDWCMGLRQYNKNKHPYHPPIKKILLMSDVRCQHYLDASNYV